MRVQKGFALLELSVAVLLATLLAVWGVHRLATSIKEAGAQARAAWMLRVRDGASQYLQRYGDAMRHASMASVLARHGYTDWSAPTLSELKADGLLSATFPLGEQGEDASIRVVRSGACPGSACALDAIVYSTRPLTEAGTGRVDEQAVAQWLMSAEGKGGWVNPRWPDRLQGSAFALGNPPWEGPALPPGTVALSVEADLGGDALRVRDRRDPDFQGDLTVQGDVLARSDILVQGHMHLSARHVAGTPCGKDGTIGIQDGAGLLNCLGGIWRPAASGLAGVYAQNSISGCRGTGTFANGYTGRCACPDGFRPVQMSETPPNLFALGYIRLYLCLG